MAFMDAYYLPNGVRIDAERLVDAALRDGEYPQMYLDTQTGALVDIPSRESLGIWVTEIGETKRYLHLEAFTDKERSDIAREFVDELLADMAQPKEVAGAREALVKGGWRAMEDFLREHTDGWIHGWDQNLGDEAWEYVDQWLLENPHVSIKKIFEGCGNCALCELMRTGEDSDPKKLLEAFATEEVMQHVARQIEKRPESSSEGDSVFSFKITLNESAPRVWRRIEVPASYSFFDLHCAIQDAMGWTDSHLHAFRVDERGQAKVKRGGRRGEYISIEFPNPEADDFGFDHDTRDEREERIADWFGKRMQQCVYEYDFGDGWDHTVLFEGEKPRETGATYPRCVAGKNACPPEDCGGLGGYDRLQEVLKDPKHEDYENVRDWFGLEGDDTFDPKAFDPAEVEFEDPAERLREYEAHMNE